MTAPEPKATRLLVPAFACPHCWLPSVEPTHPACALDPAAAALYRPSGSLCTSCREHTPAEGWKTCTRCFFFPAKFRAPERGVAS